MKFLRLYKPYTLLSLPWKSTTGPSSQRVLNVRRVAISAELMASNTTEVAIRRFFKVKTVLKCFFYFLSNQ